eukprot:CAMPEP_0118991812 /NCGR_PEP_ID=MMETSP1173-20130426/52332_1 /TAXON_ID=1034831 /ORGANISM="Rhizochromulina marina cf, Strain CCMP1243" /LENGTH=509 /DNA_ID=CAMNT_0006942963 /DNA_START=53 /DNA_END=1582 /DNA_ORIENTATION=-
MAAAQLRIQASMGHPRVLSFLSPGAVLSLRATAPALLTATPDLIARVRKSSFSGSAGRGRRRPAHYLKSQDLARAYQSNFRLHLRVLDLRRRQRWTVEQGSEDLWRLHTLLRRIATAGGASAAGQRPPLPPPVATTSRSPALVQESARCWAKRVNQWLMEVGATRECRWNDAWLRWLGVAGSAEWRKTVAAEKVAAWLPDGLGLAGCPLPRAMATHYWKTFGNSSLDAKDTQAPKGAALAVELAHRLARAATTATDRRISREQAFISKATIRVPMSSLDKSSSLMLSAGATSFSGGNTASEVGSDAGESPAEDWWRRLSRDARQRELRHEREAQVRLFNARHPSDRLFCPGCGAHQTVDEWLDRSNVCQGCGKPFLRQASGFYPRRTANAARSRAEQRWAIAIIIATSFQTFGSFLLNIRRERARTKQILQGAANGGRQPLPRRKPGRRSIHEMRDYARWVEGTELTFSPALAPATDKLALRAEAADRGVHDARADAYMKFLQRRWTAC